MNGIDFGKFKLRFLSRFFREGFCALFSAAVCQTFVNTREDVYQSIERNVDNREGSHILVDAANIGEWIASNRLVCLF